jgi:hypothetical protein
LLTDLLWEKNNVGWLKISRWKLKQTARLHGSPLLPSVWRCGCRLPRGKATSPRRSNGGESRNTTAKMARSPLPMWAQHFLFVLSHSAD